MQPRDTATPVRVEEEKAWASVRARLLQREHIVRLSRYEIGPRLGHGTHGAVYSAHDPHLEREVAIKVVHGSQAPLDSRRRFIREAQTLAALGHPNIVEVFDVGTTESDEIYIVMELLSGQTLRTWLNETERSWREIVAAFLDAGAGLAAAHDAQIVHRDVKPDNIRVTDDGIVKILDFGLARVVATPSENESRELATRPDMVWDDGSLTRTGDVIGTPRYMAPEQHDAKTISAASDQFAFCVALFEALARSPPFPGDSLESIAQSKRAHDLIPLPRDTGVPARLARILNRGLQPDPDQRHPDMHALLNALRRTVGGPAWSVWVPIAASLVGIGAAGAVLVTTTEKEACDAPGAVEDAWSQARKELARAGIVATEQSRAEAVWDEVEAQLNAQVERWRQARIDACNTHRAGELDDRAFDWAIRCDGRRALALRTVLDIFSRADTKTVRRAVGLTRDLDGRVVCSSGETDPPLPDGPRAQAILDRLTEAYARVGTPEVEAGLAEAVTAVEEARALDDQGLLAEALFAQGWLQRDVGKWEVASQSLREALMAAELSDRLSLAARIIPDSLTADIRRGVREESELVPYQDVLGRAGNPPLHTGAALVSIGYLYLGRSEHDRAEVKLSEARDLLADAGLQTSLAYNEALTGLATIRSRQGRFDEAVEMAEEAIRRRRESDGPLAMGLAYAHERLGSIHMRVGHLDDAEREYTKSIEQMETVYGPDYPDLAWPRSVLAMVWYKRGELDRAAEATERAIAMIDKPGATHGEMLATMLINYSTIEQARGRHEGARKLAERARGVFAEVSGPRSWDVADCDRRIGEALAGLDRNKDATAAYERALEVFEELGADEDVTDIRGRLGR